jgi:carboxylesterase
MKRMLWIIGLSLGLLVVLTYVLNETPFLYGEPTAYTPAPLSALMSPEAAPISQLEPKKDALIIFLHSYASSPHDFKRMADHFSPTFNVVAPLYPGCGTTEKEFQKSYFSQWYASARDAYLQNRKNYARVYLVGFSMGGAMALKLGEEFAQSAPPNGIVTISSPVFLNNACERVWLDWRLYFSRFFSWLVPVVPGPPEETLDGADRLGYSGKDFLAQVHSLKMGLKPVARDLALIQCPVLHMQSRGDKTAPFDNLFYIARHVSSPLVKVRVFDLRAWEHSRHLLPLYHSSRDQVITEVDQFLSQCEAAAQPAPAAQ